MTSLSRPLLRPLAAVVLAASLSLTAACGTTKDSTPGTSSTKVAAHHEKVTFSGKTVTPTSKAIQLKQDQDLVLDIHADAPGEIHVHSTPEQHVEYAAGDSSHTVTFNRPGVYEIESHTLDVLLFQVTVR